MTLIPARGEVEKDGNGLTTRVLMQALAGGPIVEVVPQRDADGLMVAFSVQVFD